MSPQPTSSAELADGEREQYQLEHNKSVVLTSGEDEVESSTITVEELAPATANIANALVFEFCMKYTHYNNCMCEVANMLYKVHSLLYTLLLEAAVSLY